MNRKEDILVEYEKADMNKRLHLFLQFRDLRNDFLEVELKEYKHLRFSNPNLSNQSLRTLQISGGTC